MKSAGGCRVYIAVRLAMQIMDESSESSDSVMKQIASFSKRDDLGSTDLISEGSDQFLDHTNLSKPMSDIGCQDTELMASLEGACDSDINFFLMRVGQLCGKEFQTLDEVIEEVKAIKYGCDSEASRFLDHFNKRFSVSSATLDEALAIMEVTRGSGCDRCDINTKKITALEKQNHDLIEENHNLKLQIDALKRQAAEMESKMDSAKAETFANEERFTTLKHELAKSEAQVKGLTSRVEALNTAKANAEKAYIGLEDFLNSQIAEAAELSDQRERLILLLRQENELCKEYERSLSETSPSEKPKPQYSQPKPSEKNQSLDLLAQVCDKVTEKLPGSALQEVVRIRDSAASPETRLVSIVASVADYCLALQKHIDDMNQKASDADGEVQRAEQCGLRILRAFENELRFLERLINSTDLQKVVFYKAETQSSLVLDSDAKSELVRHSAFVSQFIEDHIGMYSQDQIEKLAMSCESVDAKNVFSMMDSESFEDHVRQLIEMIEKNDGLENQFIFDIFFAQAIMNEVLQNHAQSLISQVEFVTYENQKLQRELTRQEESAAEKKEIHKRIIKKLHHKEKKLQKELLKYTQPQEETNKESLQKEKSETTVGGKNEQEMAELQEKYEAEIASLKAELETRYSGNEEVSALKKQYSRQTQMWKEKLLFMKKTVEELKEERLSLDKVLEELQEMHKEERSKFAAKARMFEEQVKSIESRVQNERKEKEELKSKNDELSKNIDHVRESLEKENDSLRSRFSSLQGHHDDNLKEFQRLRQANEELIIARAECDQKIQELQCQIESLTIMKRAAEIKVKTETEKFANERRNMSSQLTAKVTACRNELQAQIDKQEEMYAEKLQDMIDVSQDYLDSNVDITDPLAITVKLTSRLRELEDKRQHYLTVLDDFTSAQQALGITHKMSTSAAIRRIQDELNSKQTENKTLKRTIKELRTEANKQTRESKLANSDAKETKEWERWARRIYMIVNDSTATTLPAEQLRTSLEEAVLASVEQKSVLFKMKVLREEKKAFVKFQKPLLTERSHCGPCWRPIIAACAAISRMQARAGCLPLVVGSKVSASLTSDTIVPIATKRKSQHRKRVTSEL